MPATPVVLETSLGTLQIELDEVAKVAGRQPGDAQRVSHGRSGSAWSVTSS